MFNSNWKKITPMTNEGISLNLWPEKNSKPCGMPRHPTSQPSFSNTSSLRTVNAIHSVFINTWVFHIFFAPYIFMYLLKIGRHVPWTPGLHKRKTAVRISVVTTNLYQHYLNISSKENTFMPIIAGFLNHKWNSWELQCTYEQIIALH